MPTTNPSFGPKTGALDVASAFAGEIRGKTVIITGVSPKSIGSALSLAIASQSPRLLILASRTLSKIQAVTTLIHSSYPEAKVREVVIDLSSLVSVRAGAASVHEIIARDGAGKGIDVLFNNAGINLSEPKLSPEGIELQFATNHLGPWLFTNLLLPLFSLPVPHSTRKRIINTSSEAHRISPIRFSDINQTPGAKVEREDEPRRGMPERILRADGRYEPAVAYGMSKTANVLMAVGLNRRGAKSFAVMPGTIMTELVRGMDDADLRGLIHDTPESEWKTIDQGAATLVVAGFDPALDDEQGFYLEDCQMKRPWKWAVDPEKAERLWKLSEELAGEKFSYAGERLRASRL